MMTRRVFAAVALAVGVYVMAGTGVAADPVPPATTISVPEMHCSGCAKKVTSMLTGMTGVAKAETDMKAKTITVTPKAGSVLSPKSVWEAIEQAGQEPAKLTGPDGTFTA